ncbi:peptidoglycan-binding protein LysM [Myroides sp. JBRI-B21084]|uniref:peptidoglycan-binding protein LysM n=1 Tax=Myroides sp. JBRI-B21084 TaxID=3119977 RepID=UPI0026E33C12|nr:peptidoglycan-binding protein LysM [Paenimyroides cloacae]WKW47338.1 peptidoglycan-binding protein LysM [Paenimyroides cloacae]
MIKKCSYFIVPTVAIALVTMAFKSTETHDNVIDHYKVSAPMAYNVPTSQATLKSINDALIAEDFSIETSHSFIDFKEALAVKESNANYQSVNTLGYLGKYQFGKQTLKFLGIRNVNDFIKNPALQEKAFVAYVKKNKWILRNEIKKYVGKKIAGIHITESGIIAAAHLGGAGSVQNFLRSNGTIAFVDGYGTNIKTYLKVFANYDLKEIKAAKNPKISY